MNASSSREICIAGTQDAVTTLLSVLRRPWCVLELGGAGIEAVEALLAFTEAATLFDEKGYAGVVALLRHQRWCHVAEEQRRAALDGFCVPRRVRGLMGKEKRTELRDICAALLKSSLESFNGFYMRALVACAVFMGVFMGSNAKLVDWKRREYSGADVEQGFCAIASHDWGRHKGTKEVGPDT